MQLVAYGSQDVYLTGNPQITFWKMVYRRYTNFAMEAVDQTFNGSGTSRVATISRNGDLIHKCYLELDLESSTKACSVVESIELEIGGQQIDKQTGEWLDIWEQLSCPPEKSVDSKMNNDSSNKKFLPLHFFFCDNPGLALPLIALQYHEVRIKINFNASYKRQNGEEPQLWVDYIYLDTDERRRMAQSSHELLITQIQHQEESITNASLKPRLNFNHPCKELIWTTNSPYREREWGLKLNGHDRFAPRNQKYFQAVQPYQHHTNIPQGEKIHVYSFCLKPEEAQPTGSCNFSRIDNAQLNYKASNAVANQQPGQTKIYATNWNVLRIMSGMGGLAYSN